MRRLTVFVLLMLIMPVTMAEARSVHSTSAVDMFPNGDMQDSNQWDFKRHLAFTQENKAEDGQYVMGMVADGHMTLGISLPEHLDHQTVWAVSYTHLTLPTN